MKNSKILVVGLIGLLFAFGMTVTGCDETSSSKNKVPEVPEVLNWNLTGSNYYSSFSGIRVNGNTQNADRVSIYYNDSSVRAQGQFEVVYVNRDISGFGSFNYTFTDLSQNTTYYFWIQPTSRTHGQIVGPKTSSFTRPGP